MFTQEDLALTNHFLGQVVPDLECDGGAQLSDWAGKDTTIVYGPWIITRSVEGGLCQVDKLIQLPSTSRFTDGLREETFATDVSLEGALKTIAKEEFAENLDYWFMNLLPEGENYN